MKGFKNEAEAIEWLNKHPTYLDLQ